MIVLLALCLAAYGGFRYALKQEEATRLRVILSAGVACAIAGTILLGMFVGPAGPVWGFDLFGTGVYTGVYCFVLGCVVGVVALLLRGGGGGWLGGRP